MTTLWLVLGIWLGAMFLSAWLYFTTKLVVAAYFNVKRQFQRREKNGEESA